MEVGQGRIRAGGNDLDLTYSIGRDIGVSPGVFLDALMQARGLRHRAVESPSALKTDEIVRRVTACLLGDRENRFGARPTAEDERIVGRCVSRSVAAGEPVQVLVMWGGVKHYVPDDEQGIDLAEWFALRQFEGLREAIHAVYRPGIEVRFYLEDFGVLYEDAGGRGPEIRRRVERSIEKYLGQFEALLATVGGGWAEGVRVSRLAGSDEELERFTRQADANLSLLHEYWAQSEGLSAEEAGSLGSYRELQKAGWSGAIPEAMRRHYLKRLGSLYPQAGEEERVNRVQRYLAVVLLYGQLGLIRGREPDSVKVSMFKPAPGIPAERVLGRIHLRCLPRSESSQTMPPWTCKGCFGFRRGGAAGLALKSFRLCYEEGRRFESGVLRVRSKEGSVSIRADVLLSESMPGGRRVRLERYPAAAPEAAGAPQPAESAAHT